MSALGKGWFNIVDDLDDLDKGSTWVADRIEQEAQDLLAKHAQFQRLHPE